MKNTLTTAFDLFLISFNGNLQQFVFSAEPETLGNLIQEHGKHGIVFIKRYNRPKCAFQTMNKADIKNFFGFDTHSIQQLQAKNFIK